MSQVSAEAFRAHFSTLLQLSLDTRVPNTLKKPTYTMSTYTPCSCLVFNMKGYLLGAPLPRHSLPTPLTLMMSSTFARCTWLILEFLFQKQLTIQGKIVDMHYSNSRNKYEDWLCNTVSWSLLVLWLPCLRNAVTHYCTHIALSVKIAIDLCTWVHGTPTFGIADLVRLFLVSMPCCSISLLSQHCSGL